MPATAKQGLYQQHANNANGTNFRK